MSEAGGERLQGVVIDEAMFLSDEQWQKLLDLCNNIDSEFYLKTGTTYDRVMRVANVRSPQAFKVALEIRDTHIRAVKHYNHVQDTIEFFRVRRNVQKGILHPGPVWVAIYGRDVWPVQADAQA